LSELIEGEQSICLSPFVCWRLRRGVSTFYRAVSVSNTPPRCRGPVGAFQHLQRPGACSSSPTPHITNSDFPPPLPPFSTLNQRAPIHP
jgi:hypothetical protein